MVMTFWVKATKTGTYCVALRNGTSTLAYVMEYTVNASNTWEKKTLRFTHSMAGTWAYDTAIGMTVVWTLSSGSTFQTSANSWNTGNFIATANQVNGTDSTSNNFWLSDICLVEDNDGRTRNPDFMYAGRDVFEELQLCQRYYEKSYELEVAIGTPLANGGYSVGSAVSNTTSVRQTLVAFRQEKRADPIVVSYASTTGAINSAVFYDGTAVVATPLISPSFIGFAIGASGTLSGKTANSGIAITGQYTADAEL
jgi:hypothetical protein